MAAGTIQVGGGCDSQKGPASGELTRVTAAPLPPGLENHATFSASHDYPLRAPSKRSNSNRKKLPGSFLPFSASTRLEIPPLQFPRVLPPPELQELQKIGTRDLFRMGCDVHLGR